MAKLGLSAEEWVAVDRAILAAPPSVRTPELAEAQKGVRELLEEVLEQRDRMGDTRGLFDVVCSLCGEAIVAREQDYFIEHELGKKYHAECWLKR